MVKRFFRFISQEIGGLHEAAYLLGIFAFLSQILALVRDRLLAFMFGASHSLDIYYAAFRVPDFIFVSIASMVSLSVLIPFLIERLDRGETEAKEFIDSIFTVFFFVIGTVAVVAFIFAPFLMRLFFPEFSHDFPTLISMTRIMLLSPIFLGFSNFLASITQVYKRFFIYALSPIVYNMGIIFGVVVIYPLTHSIQALAWGVAFGAFLHAFIQVPFAMHKSLFPKIKIPFNFQVVKKVFLISLPRTITISSNEIAEFFLVVLAASLSGGAISIFNFSWNLQSVPLSIIGVSYTLAAFPILTRLFTNGETGKFITQMVVSTKHILFWSVPIMTLFIVLRAQIVRVILGSGQFNWSDTKLTAAALALFTVSLIPQSLVMLFVRAYYSRGNTKKPLLMNLISASLIVGFSYFFVKFFYVMPMFRHIVESLLHVENVPGTSVLMLPLGFSIGVTVNMIIHWVAFELDFGGYTMALIKSIWQILLSSFVMSVVTYYLLNLFGRYFSMNTFSGVFLQAFIAGIIGIGVCIGVLFWTKNHEIKIIIRTMKHKIWKPGVVPPDPAM